MTRTLLAVAAALSFALAPVGISGAVAQEKAKVAKAGKDQKVCRSRQPSGNIKTWICRKDQPCCVSHTFNLYTCGSQLLRCL